VCLLRFGAERSNVDIIILDIPVSTRRRSWLNMILRSLAVSLSVLPSSPSGAIAMTCLVFTHRFSDVLEWEVAL